LCIHSKYDNLSSPKSAEVVLDGISSEIKQYVELNDSYHMVLYDNEKEFVMNTVKEFLSRFAAVENEKEAVCI
jgi:carboxylesterase